MTLSFLSRYRVGDVLKYEGHYLMVLRENDAEICKDCFFVCRTGCHLSYRPCIRTNRNDHTDVIFKEISEIEYLVLQGE